MKVYEFRIIGLQENDHRKKMKYICESPWLGIRFIYLYLIEGQVVPGVLGLRW